MFHTVFHMVPYGTDVVLSPGHFVRTSNVDGRGGEGGVVRVDMQNQTLRVLHALSSVRIVLQTILSSPIPLLARSDRDCMVLHCY
jgi:hypothetical protein